MAKERIELSLKILAIWGRLKSNIEAMAENNGLTMQQVFLLHKLYQRGPLLMSALAKHLHCDASNVTGIVDRLESRCFVIRQDLPNDRRAKQLEITDDGKKIIKQMLKNLPDGVGFDKLTASEIRTLLKLTAKIVED